MRADVAVKSVPPVVWGDTKVITTDLLASLYGADAKQIQNNYLRNEGRFEEGKHFYKISGEELREFKNRPSLRGSVGKNAKSLVLWTERGGSGSGIQTVNARYLHAFLEVGKDFATWMKDRIQQYGFVLNQDFTMEEILTSPKSGSAKARARPAIEYHLSLDMAKELAMVERTEKGKQARQYFIACEKQLREGAQDWRLLRHGAAFHLKAISLPHLEEVNVGFGQI